MTSNKNQKFYFSEIGQEEKVKYLYQSANQNLHAHIWQEGEDKKDLENFSIDKFDEETSSLILTHKPSGILGKLSFSKHRNQEVLLKVLIDPIYLFTKTYLDYDLEKNIFCTKINNSVFKGQQRANYRLEANSVIRIGFTINRNTFNAIDLSASGISFQVENNHEAFEVGQTHQNGMVSLGSKQFEISKLKIVEKEEDQWEKANDTLVKGYKVAIQFTEVSKEVESNLYLTISSEARVQEIKKMFSEKK